MNFKKIRTFAEKAGIHNVDTCDLNIVDNPKLTELYCFWHISFNIPPEIISYLHLQRMLEAYAGSVSWEGTNHFDVDKAVISSKAVSLFEEFHFKNLQMKNIVTLEDKVLITNQLPLLGYNDRYEVAVANKKVIKTNRAFTTKRNVIASDALLLLKNLANCVEYNENVFLQVLKKNANKLGGLDEIDQLLFVEKFLK